MSDLTYKLAHRDYIDVIGAIEWSVPVTHDVLFTHDVDNNEDGYFYSICALTDGEWWSYYFGMVFQQWATERHKQADHVKRLTELKAKYPNMVFHISIGVLKKIQGPRINKIIIEEIEGLLIHTEWHEELINKKKIYKYIATHTYAISNEGFTQHLDANEMVFGAVYNGT